MEVLTVAFHALKDVGEEIAQISVCVKIMQHVIHSLEIVSVEKDG